MQLRPHGRLYLCRTLLLPTAETHAASVARFSPLHFPRRITRPVSYYALFEGWLYKANLLVV